MARQCNHVAVVTILLLRLVQIAELLESGHLRKAEYLTDTEEARAINLFANIWGTGPNTARRWYEMGLRTLADVVDRGHPTPQQLIGIKYYDVR